MILKDDNHFILEDHEDLILNGVFVRSFVWNRNGFTCVINSKKWPTEYDTGAILTVTLACTYKCVSAYPTTFSMPLQELCMCDNFVLRFATSLNQGIMA